MVQVSGVRYPMVAMPLLPRFWDMAETQRDSSILGRERCSTLERTRDASAPKPGMRMSTLSRDLRARGHLRGRFRQGGSVAPHVIALSRRATCLWPCLLGPAYTPIRRGDARNTYRLRSPVA